MRPIRPEISRRAARGVTLLELVIAIVVTGIIVAATAFFVYPMRQSTDLVARAELADIADNALQRIGRDVRLALPNSVRVDGTGKFIEFLAIRAAGRYRADGGGAAGGTNCDNDDASLVAPGNDQLSFDLAAGDRCFKSIGKVPNGGTILASDSLVLNNYGPGFAGQNAYEAGAANRVQIGSVDAASEATRDRISFAPRTFVRALHDSPGKRFYVISGPVSFVCDTVARSITRYSGYSIAATQPTPPAGATSVALIAENVADCSFDYSANVAPQIGLLTLRVQLSKILSGGETEAVNLYHAVHVSNIP